MNFNKFEIYGNPTLQQGGWGRTGADNDYVMYAPSDPNYNYRICTLEYVPQHHPTQMTITGIASKELEVSVLVLRSDNYIIASLGWQENGYTFNLGSIYDKLGVMFRFKNGDTITPNLVSFDIIGGWHDTPHYIHKTDTDTITTLPAVLYPTGTTATVGLKGNEEHTGTPTPDSPIQPSECGDYSNLWSYHPDKTSGGVRLLWDGEKINYSNTCTNASNSIMTINLKKGTYTLKANANRIPVENDYSCIDIYHPSSGLFKPVTNRNAVNGKVTFTLDDDLSNVSLRIRLDNGTNYDGFEIRPMLNIGETSLPYDVYGHYKIPILNNSQTTNVYLGEVQTTRKVKKYVVTGQESEWNYDSTYTRFTLRIPNAYFTANRSDETPCTHYVSIHDGRAVGDVPDKSIYVTSGGGTVYINIVDLTYNSLSDFKTYLQQQYTAGTPVTIWYVLAEPTTGIVNEPLRKIGNYADEVSGITIPTIAGANTISVDTTLQPSEVTVNYKGWHPVQSVHEKSRNLFDWNWLVDGYHLDAQTGLPTTHSKRVSILQPIDVSRLTTATISYESINVETLYAMYSVLTTENILIRRVTSVASGSTLDLSGGDKLYIAFYNGAPSGATAITKDNITSIMLNAGSTTLPYEPYWT